MRSSPMRTLALNPAGTKARDSSGNDLNVIRKKIDPALEAWKTAHNAT